MLYIRKLSLQQRRMYGISSCATSRRRNETFSRYLSPPSSSHHCACLCRVFMQTKATTWCSRPRYVTHFSCSFFINWYYAGVLVPHRSKMPARVRLRASLAHNQTLLQQVALLVIDAGLDKRSLLPPVLLIRNRVDGSDAREACAANLNMCDSAEVTSVSTCTHLNQLEMQYEIYRKSGCLTHDLLQLADKGCLFMDSLSKSFVFVEWLALLEELVACSLLPCRYVKLVCCQMSFFSPRRGSLRGSKWGVLWMRNDRHAPCWGDADLPPPSFFEMPLKSFVIIRNHIKLSGPVRISGRRSYCYFGTKLLDSN